MENRKLDKYVAISKIISLVAIPIVLAVVGWTIQATLSQDVVKKEYVQLAISILSDKSKSENEEMKAWAISILGKYSPVPFSGGVKEGFAVGFAVCPRLPHLPPVARQPKQPNFCVPTCRDGFARLHDGMKKH